MKRIDTLSNRLVQALNEANISGSDLAKKVGISKQAISNYCTDFRSPKLPTVRIMAEELNVSVMWLMGYDVPKEQKKPITDERDKLDSKTQIALQKISQLNDKNLEIALAYLDIVLEHQENQDK